MSLLFIGYILVFPTCATFYLGFGRAGSMGSQLRTAGSSSNYISFASFVNVSTTLAGTNDYFEVADGFIAFNLSKSIVHTLTPYPLQQGDSLYFGLSNPVTDEVFGSSTGNYSNLYVSEVPLLSASTPPLFEDIISQWTVAPIFAAASDCLFSPPPIHITCIVPNVIVGWAVASDTSSFCRMIKSSACSPGGQLNQSLSVYYPKPFEADTQPSLGFTGMYSEAPPDFMQEAILRRFVADGWPIDTDQAAYPTGMPSIWVRPISNVTDVMETAENDYFGFKIASCVLLGVIVSLVATAFGLDVYTDILVMRLIDRQKAVNMANETERVKRKERLEKLNID